MTAVGVPWDADVDWASYDLVVVRSTWDYEPWRDEGRVLTATGSLSPYDWDIGLRDPSPEQRAVAEQVLAAVDEPLLYARIDLLDGPVGPLLLELELTEPYLFLELADGAADRLAAAIAGWSDLGESG